MLKRCGHFLLRHLVAAGLLVGSTTAVSADEADSLAARPRPRRISAAPT